MFGFLCSNSLNPSAGLYVVCVIVSNIRNPQLPPKLLLKDYCWNYPFLEQVAEAEGGIPICLVKSLRFS